VIDDKEGREPVALPEITLMPGQFFMVYATYEEPAENSSYVSLKLGSSDSLSLLKGNEVVNFLDWQKGEAPSGFSYGRWPDGTGETQTLKPTPSTANEKLEDGPLENEVVDNVEPQENVENQNTEIFNREKVIDVYIELKPEDWQAILADPRAKEYKPSTITYNGIKLENVAFRIKGNFSLSFVLGENFSGGNSERYSFKVDMNRYVEEQTLLGLKKLNFNNNVSDPSYMRESLSYDLMRYMGLPTPRLAYVNLYINGKLHGFYTAVEQVDSIFVKQKFANGDGDLYKPFGNKGRDLIWISDNFSDYSGIELKTNEDTSDNAAFMTMIDVLNHGTDYESVLNVDNILRYLAVNTAMSNLDSYQGPNAHNYYLYEEKGIFSIIPWDFNMSFGGYNSRCSEEEILGLLIDEPTTLSTMAQRPLIDKLLQNAAYREAYHGHFETLINGPLNPDTMAQTINDIATLIRDFVYVDPSAFYTPEEFEASLSGLTEPPNGTILLEGENFKVDGKFGLQYFIEQRVANIRAQLDGTIPSSGEGTISCTLGWKEWSALWGE